MTAFAIEQGACGIGSARYEDGLLVLPDGSERGIETVAGFTTETVEDGPSLHRTTTTLAGSLRHTLDGQRSDTSLPFPFRFAVSTMRAGLGVIEEGLRTSADLRAVITFVDDADIVASMTPDLADLIRRDIALVHAAIDRVARSADAPVAEQKLPETVPLSDSSTEAALTSIFRYEKRNGRLRRVPVDDTQT